MQDQTAEGCLEIAENILKRVADTPELTHDVVMEVTASAQAWALLGIGRLLMQGESVLPDGTLFRLGKSQPAFTDPDA